MNNQVTLLGRSDATDYGWTVRTKQHPGELEILVEHSKRKGKWEPLAVQIRVSRSGSVTVGAVTNQLTPRGQNET